MPDSMVKPLAGKVALVTGAASGIGRATALRLALEGAVLALGDLNLAGAEATAAEIGPAATAIRYDAADGESCRALVDQAVGLLGRLDAVDRAERAAEHVVKAAVLVRPLERDDVDRLLDDADRPVVAARVEADRAGLLLGEVPALAAEAHPLLHLGERSRERERLLGGSLKDVERQALRRALADPGEAGQLGDEVLDGRAVDHASILPGGDGRTAKPVTA